MPRANRVLSVLLLAGGIELPVEAPGEDVSSQVIDVGSRKQLFVDELLIDSQRDVALLMNPSHATGELLLTADQPHEEGGAPVQE